MVPPKMSEKGNSTNSLRLTLWFFRLSHHRRWMNGDAMQGADFGALFPSIQAGNIANVRNLLSGKIDVNLSQTTIDGDIYAPLHFAARWNQPEIIALLVEAGGNINLPLNYHEFTPLHAAGSAGHADALRALIALKADVHASGPDGSPLHVAARNGRSECVKLLLENKSEVNAARHGPPKTTPFLEACDTRPLFWKTTHVECLEALVAARADAYATDSDGRSALHLAAKRGNAQLLRLLLEQFMGDSSVDACDDAGETPLFAAAETGQVEAGRLLIEKGASVDSKSKASFFFFFPPLIPYYSCFCLFQKWLGVTCKAQRIVFDNYVFFLAVWRDCGASGGDF